MFYLPGSVDNFSYDQNTRTYRNLRELSVPVTAGFHVAVGLGSQSRKPAQINNAADSYNNMKIAVLNDTELAALFDDTTSDCDDLSDDASSPSWSHKDHDADPQVNAQAAERRRLRASKVHKAHSSLASKIGWNAHGVSGCSDDDASGSGASSRAAGHYVNTSRRRLPKEIVREQRRIRNRESALRYRERKQVELDMLYQRIADLESEASALRERLSIYEPVDVKDYKSGLVNANKGDMRFTARITAII